MITSLRLLTLAFACIFNTKSFYVIPVFEKTYKLKRHELISSSPCLLLCILLSCESRFKRSMSVWYKYTHQYVKRKFTRYLACFETNTPAVYCHWYGDEIISLINQIYNELISWSFQMTSDYLAIVSNDNKLIK